MIIMVIIHMKEMPEAFTQTSFCPAVTAIAYSGETNHNYSVCLEFMCRHASSADFY